MRRELRPTCPTRCRAAPRGSTHAPASSREEGPTPRSRRRESRVETLAREGVEGSGAPGRSEPWLRSAGGIRPGPAGSRRQHSDEEGRVEKSRAGRPRAGTPVTIARRARRRPRWPRRPRPRAIQRSAGGWRGLERMCPLPDADRSNEANQSGRRPGIARWPLAGCRWRDEDLPQGGLLGRRTVFGRGRSREAPARPHRGVARGQGEPVGSCRSRRWALALEPAGQLPAERIG